MNGQKRTKERWILAMRLRITGQEKRDGYVNEACPGDEELKLLVLDYLQAGEGLFNDPGGPVELRESSNASVGT